MLPVILLISDTLVKEKVGSLTCWVGSKQSHQCGQVTKGKSCLLHLLSATPPFLMHHNFDFLIPQFSELHNIVLLVALEIALLFFFKKISFFQTQSTPRHSAK